MLDQGLLELKGARAESRYTTLANLKFISGLMTQRSPLAGIDTRYNSRFLGGRPDALIRGSNVEISNKLTLIRRPGLVAYGISSIPAPLTFYGWESISPFGISLLVDTKPSVYVYSPTATGVYLNKSPLAGQTNFAQLANTVYLGDGADLYKITGPNLLANSNNPAVSPWSLGGGVTSTPNFATDPLGGNTANLITWGGTGVTRSVQQNVSPSITPMLNNTFTYSVWLKQNASSTTVNLLLKDSGGHVAANVTVTPTTTWTRFQVTGMLISGAIITEVFSPSVNTTTLMWGAQLEVGGPATPANITGSHVQGVSLWGIIAPTVQPSAPLFAGTNNATVGFNYAYSFLNSATGQPSNISPQTGSTGPLVNQDVNILGVGSTDPQVDKIAIYRTTDGGAILYQLTVIANPGGVGFAFLDTGALALNTQIYAPVGFLNSPPPAGMLDPISHANRYWGHVSNILYYSTASDNATLLNVLFNGVLSESWSPGNVIPFDAPITRKLSTAAGLLVWTVKDLWLVTGSTLSSPFLPVKILQGHGLLNWNAMDVDGSTVLAQLADKQIISLNPGTGSLEVGFPIGDQIDSLISPSSSYLVRHIAGSQDNAIYLGDGSSGWFRLNPNQAGASVSGEQTEVWSPFATIAGGCAAIGSVQVSPGKVLLLVGQATDGPLLVRNLNTFSDNGKTYTWTADIGSLVLATPGTLAETESITLEMTGIQAGVAVLLDEIAESYAAPFESLPLSVDDPPQLATSQSLLSKRFYLSQGTAPPLCRHLQIRLSGAAAETQDEVLSLSIRGALIPEQA